ncbi:unnamed protein product [Microthlaspi erraticum]|uniref:NYN domain-containing protein n=1 Tax=Microthlaspi erraticum TaxID=1685480 RepID=A0A6D2JLN9_9BRAS|nr:unnamed protein product [Microthlaspi erraticum]CAA7052510.1 unnamed protein product [Microthlaspi erraticum]
MDTDKDTGEPPRFAWNTRLFWDLVDFPYPHDRDLHRFYFHVRHAIAESSSVGRLSIHAYGEELTDRKMNTFYNARISLEYGPADKLERLNKMLVDMLEFAHITPRPDNVNLLIASKDMPDQDTELFDVMEAMRMRGCRVFFVVPDDSQFPPRDSASLVWRWDVLLDGGSPTVTNTDSVSVSQGALKAVGKTGVFWDVDDFPFPQSGRGIREIVKSIFKKQYNETEVSIRVYGGEIQFTTEFLDMHRFTFVKRSDKYSRLNKMLLDIGLWVLDAPKHCPLPSNVVVAAKNIKEKTEYVRYLENLNSVNFRVFVVVPDDVKPEEVNIPSVMRAWYWKDVQVLGKPIPRDEYRALLARGERNETLFNPDNCGKDADDGGEDADDEACHRLIHY